MATMAPSNASDYEALMVRIGVATLASTVLGLLVALLALYFDLRAFSDRGEGRDAPPRVVPQSPEEELPEGASHLTRNPIATLDPAREGESLGGPDLWEVPAMIYVPPPEERLVEARERANGNLPPVYGPQDVGEPGLGRETRGIESPSGAKKPPNTAGIRGRPKVILKREKAVVGKETTDRIVAMSGPDARAVGGTEAPQRPVADGIEGETEEPKVWQGESMEGVATPLVEPRNAHALGRIPRPVVPRGMEAGVSGKHISLTVLIDEGGTARVLATNSEIDSPFLIQRAIENVERVGWRSSVDELGNSRSQVVVVQFLFD